MIKTLKRLAAAASASLALPLLVMAPMANAASSSFNSFTATEVSTWSADRTFPSGGVASVSAQGRSDVLELKINKNRAASVDYYKTEGVQKRANFGNSINADLYVDGAWDKVNVRAGLWGVGENTSNVISAYPIIEFTTAGSNNFKGWRVWNGTGWENKITATYNAWSSVKIDLVNNKFKFSVNGNEIATTNANNTTSINAAIFNSYNYSQDNYSVLWHNGVPKVLNSEDECKNDGWKVFVAGFKNQGQCVSSVANKK